MTKCKVSSERNVKMHWYTKSPPVTMYKWDPYSVIN